MYYSKVVLTPDIQNFLNVDCYKKAGLFDTFDSMQNFFKLLNCTIMQRFSDAGSRLAEALIKTTERVRRFLLCVHRDIFCNFLCWYLKKQTKMEPYQL